MMSAEGDTRVVVITGASNGIGAATATLFARKGCRLVLHGRNEGKLQTVVQQCIAEGLDSNKIAIVKGDLKDDSTVSDIVRVTLETFGTIHVLMNNAGYIAQGEGPLHKQGTVEGMDDMYRINIRVPYMLVQAFVEELTKNKGVVINNSSGYSVIPDPNMTAYCTTKAGLDHLTKIMAMTLATRGVRVNSLNCGFVRTDIIRKKLGEEVEDPFFAHQETLSPLEQKLATPEDIANVAVFLASEKSSALTGSNVFCDRGATLMSPLFDVKTMN